MESDLYSIEVAVCMRKRERKREIGQQEWSVLAKESEGSSPESIPDIEV